MSHGHVSVIMLDYNEPEETVRCLDSFKDLQYCDLEIILLENGPLPGKLERLREGLDRIAPLTENMGGLAGANEAGVQPLEMRTLHGFTLTILVSKVNLGFTGGNNAVLRHLLDRGGTSFFFLLNNDVRVSDKRLIDVLIEPFDHPDIGITGPVVMNYPSVESVQSIGARIDLRTSAIFFNTSLNDFDQRRNVHEVDYISGCAMMIRHEVVQSIGCLVDHYFAYWEESDYCFRARGVGYRTVVCLAAKIDHMGGLASVRSDFSIYLYTRNRYFFMLDHARDKYPIFLINYFLRIFMKEMSLALRDDRIKAFFRGTFRGLRQDRSRY